MTRHIIGLALGSIIALTSAGAAERSGSAPVPVRVTFVKDVAPIFQRSCQRCHRPGEIAPMSLMTYQDARPWARSILEKVSLREMPPWHADPAIGRYVNDPRLSEAEIATITQWVNGGAIEGNPADLPPVPAALSHQGWSIGEPDLVLTMAEDFVVPADGYDQYPSFYLPTGLTEERWVQAVEVRPGNRKVVHHVMAYTMQQDEPDTGDDGGWQGWLAGLMTEFAVGNNGDLFPEGTGKLLKPGSQIRLQVHYHSAGEAQRDRTTIGFKFYPKGVVPSRVVSRGIRTHDIEIPPGAGNVRHEAVYTLGQPARILSFQPHMHYRGKAMSLEAIYPDGHKEMLSSVPHFRFAWQITYTFKDPPVLPAGTQLHMVAYHDNSAANPYNPDPTKTVWWGEQTTDEMAIGWTDIVYLSEKEYAAAVAGATTHTAATRP